MTPDEVMTVLETIAEFNYKFIILPEKRQRWLFARHIQIIRLHRSPSSALESIKAINDQLLTIIINL
ncbi:hypothetical protein [Radiobacillus sp. PE A8.2]|uniref:hypothetical protein n=1 Tax=Radiobacillus sp. PE A8.2 TaxID=3380349 RepID=UPI0038905846